MKIHIAYNFVDGPWGGGNQFLKALRESFRSMGVYEENFSDAEILIINSYHIGSEKIIKEVIKRKNSGNPPRVIHRLDGPFSLVRGFSDKTDVAVGRLNRLVADATVFQSSWVREKLPREGLRAPHAVINNAPQKNMFKPEGINKKHSEKFQVVTTVWSSNKNKGFDVLKWMDQNLDFSQLSLTLIGNSPVKFTNIVHIPPLGSAELSKRLVNYDLFFAPFRNEPCSNSIIEALHSGLPVLAKRDGGNPEIIGKGGLLFDHQDEILHQLLKAQRELDSLRDAIQVQSIDEVATQYLLLAKSIASEPPHKPGIVSKLFFATLHTSPFAVAVRRINLHLASRCFLN